MFQLGLIWPAEEPSAMWTIPAETIRDLGLEAVGGKFGSYKGVSDYE